MAANRRRRAPRADAELLYTVAQAQACLAQVQDLYDGEPAGRA